MKRLIFLFFLLLGMCNATAQVTTSSLRGMVVNSSNEILIGATVVLSHPETGRSYAVATDAQGRYALHGVRPADDYRLEVSYVGYESLVVGALSLRVGEVREQNIELCENLAIKEVVVSGSDVAAGEVGNRFSQKLISQLPTLSRSLYDVVRLTPQAMLTKGGGVSYGGVSNRYNSFMINGVANNDMYGLSSSGTNGGLSNANPVSLDAIEQLDVVVASYDVRMSGFGGGAINAITKSGTNEFRGSAYTYYNNQDFYGTTPGKDVAKRQKLQDQTSQIYGVTFGGPIVKDKLFFFVSGELNLDRSPSSYFLGYDGVALNGQELERVAQRYKALTGYNGGGVGRRDVEQRSGSLLANLEWHINERNRMTASYSYLDARAEEYANSLSSFTFCGSGYANYSTAHHLALSLESRLSDGVHNSLRVGFSKVEDGRSPDVEGLLPSVIIKNTGTTGGVTLNIGNNRYAGVNALKQSVLTLTDDVMIDRGAHTITVGMHHELYNIHNRYLANAYGTYTYNSVEDFERDKAAIYEYNYTDPVVAGSTTWGPKFHAAELNVYLQDRWSLGRGLQLSYGVRATLPLIFNRPTPNKSFNSSTIAEKHGVRIGDVPRAQLLLSPRVGVDWACDYDWGRLAVEGGAGVFTGQVPFVWIVNNYSNTGVEQKGVRLTGADVPAFTVKPSPTTESNTRFMLNAMNDEFRYPQNLKANVSVSAHMRGGWRTQVGVLYTKTLHNAVFRNLAVERTGGSVYAVPSVGGSAAAGAVPAYKSEVSDYSAIYYLDNTSKGYTYSLSASVSKDFKWGLSVAASYIFGHAYSVCDVPSTSSSSNWNRTYAVDLNSPELTFSAFDVPHKFSLAVTYRKRYAKLMELSAGVVYQVNSGQRYSLCFGETVDFNGDGAYGSTPMYIPTQEEMQRMNFADEGSMQKWNEYIESSDYLSSHRGEFAERNAMQTPAEHTIDLHLAHGFYFSQKSSRKVELSLDVMNFGNLLCRDWGTYYNVSGLRLQPVTITSQKDGVAVYKFTDAKLTTDDLLSRWRMQIGVRVVF
ncbi:MAG: TonB-dependent receptor [Alistipes sp.]|nr:TonB-dependent receptor [Alistipes sp.]